MEEQLTSFKTAKLAEEKGFNWKCRGRIHCSHFHFVKKNIIPINVPINEDETFAPIEDWNNKKHQDPNNKNGTLTGLYLSLPTQSLLQKWLREKHYIHINLFTSFENMKMIYDVDIFQQYQDSLKCKKSLYGKTYEETLEKGLFEALKLII